ncbi:hypothetical protein D9756_003348 [Leucocoprinus leucothites]|uniref:Selenoprotein O n=1 Tax=Leucocoprinus leucothites TaxID=201217 RepID=A0A8H5LJT2_9AGAR|nr:hypothetical protein D9756_003348 [Leucoagaricus leucothites]
MRLPLHRMTSTAKYPISALPLPPLSSLLTQKLTPDVHTGSVAKFREAQKLNPSIQRRARLLSPECHFSHVSPFPVSFPYDIKPPEEEDPNDTDKGEYVERWLAERESTDPQPPPAQYPDAPLRKYYAKNRDQPIELIGISETGLMDCVPHLDVGDAFTLIGVPTLSDEFGDEGDGVESEREDVRAARKDLIDILSGHAMLMSDEFAPWSMRYSGHQFGSWAGQLGDGRAISVVVTPHPTKPGEVYELQLKGGGRTPFSRSADGLAVLRSSIREYLCSEAMHALHIPTTRALSLISLPALSVARERVETACVVARVAPSFIRIGNFEAFNGPTNMFFFGGGQQKPDYEALRILGEYVAKDVLKLELKEGEAWGEKLVLDVAERNAKMVAGWQAYGFMHGVINTDNVSILGLTIDYGPYAFMDVFDSFHICNHTDESGRYAYKYQPNMIVYALRALLNALAPVIGAEQMSFNGQAVSKDWTKDVTSDQIEAWSEKGKELRTEVERVVQQTCSTEYGRLFRNRLGLRKQDPKDQSQLFQPLLDVMESQKLDFHITFRNLLDFDPAWDEKGTEIDAYIAKILTATPDASTLKTEEASGQWKDWLKVYTERVRAEFSEGLWGDAEKAKEERRECMRLANPRFVLRQWVLEEVIQRAERDSTSGKRVLAKVMHMACNPYEAWGAEGDEGPEAELEKEEREERRFCGIGEKKMLGFQCSCSS